jgi:Family of unknown function (DUF5362)
MNEAFSTLPNTRMVVSKMTKDMQFVGIFFIIGGALYCITIVGALLGIPLIISGLRLRESADSFNSYLGSGNDGLLEDALQKQSKFFFIQKVLIIISIVFFVLYLIFIFTVGISMMHSFGSHYPNV